MKKKEVVAFIPARGGSKGIPGKNIKLINGKPLIEYTIKQALNSEYVARVVVSTDCEAIAKVALSCGAEVPFMRPSYLASDQCTTESAMEHFIDFCDSVGYAPDYIMLLQATSPVRFQYTIDNAVKYIIESTFDSILAVSESHRFFWKNKSSPTATYNYSERPRRQDINPHDRYYTETGSIYITNVELFKKFKNRLCGKIGLFEIDEVESFEIDTMLDFDFCEHLIKKLNIR